MPFQTSRQPYDAQHLEINIETSYNTQNFFNCHYLRGFNHHQENMFLLLATIQPISITDLFCYFNEARSRLQLHVHIVQREDQECWNITHHKAGRNQRNSWSLVVITRININSFYPLITCICLQTMRKFIMIEKHETTVIQMNSGMNYPHPFLQRSSLLDQFQVNCLNLITDQTNNIIQEDVRTGIKVIGKKEQKYTVSSL